MKINWRDECTPFQRKVYEALLRIPKGQVRTYAEVARMVGRPKAARAVGQACRSNRWAPAIPCHRVVAAGGRLGGYSGPGGLSAKRRLLERERVAARHHQSASQNPTSGNEKWDFEKRTAYGILPA